jgi:hypothetical protein
MTESKDSVFQVFQRHGVPFAVIGGYAVIVHGFVRATEDYDLVFLRTPDSEARLLAALKEVNARWIDEEIDPATGIERQIPVSESYVRGQRLMMLITDVGFVDVFDYVPGCEDASVADLMAEALVVDGIRYASKAWVLRMKKAAGRTKDLLDIENLEQAG